MVKTYMSQTKWKRGINILDAYHILKNTRNYLNKKELKFFRQPIYARNEEEFINKSRYPLNCLNTKERLSDKYCFSRIN